MDEKAFQYTYSAAQQAQIKKIREKYVPAQEAQPDKLEQLRQLDAGVTRKGTVVSLILGVLGTLILGTGMSMIMTELGAMLGLRDMAMPVGIAIGLVGTVLVCLAYPAYMGITQKERQRIAPQILQLTDELLK